MPKIMSWKKVKGRSNCTGVCERVWNQSLPGVVPEVEPAAQFRIGTGE